MLQILKSVAFAFLKCLHLRIFNMLLKYEQKCTHRHLIKK